MSRTWAYANAFHGVGEQFIEPVTNKYTPAEAAQAASQIVLDANGYPTSLPAGTFWLAGEVGYQTGRAVHPTLNVEATTYLHGVFVLTYAGTGTVSLEGSNYFRRDMNKIILNQPGRIVAVWEDPFQSMQVLISNIDPNDPIHDLRLWVPAYDGAGLTLTENANLQPGQIAGSLEPLPGEPEPLFHPLFLQHLAELPEGGVLRLMEWVRVNGLDSTPIDWSHRGNPQACGRAISVVDQGYTRYPIPGLSQRAGTPYEFLIDLCNETQRDLWLLFPHTATPDLIDNTAALVAQRLNPNRRVFVEYSNEMWNDYGPYQPQRTAAANRASQQFSLPLAQLSSNQIGWGAGRLQGEGIKRFEDAWKAAGQSDARLVNVAAGWSISPDFNRGVLDGMKSVDPNLPETLAITNYFGNDSHGSIYFSHPFGTDPGQWSAALFDSAAEIIRRELYTIAAAWEGSGLLAAEYGIPLISYEGGTHTTAVGYGDYNNPAHVDFMGFMRALHKSTQMQALYREHYALFSVIGGLMPSVYMDISPWDSGGYFGAKEYVTEVGSPKWQAIQSWGQLQQGRRSALNPLGTRPALQPFSTAGEMGMPYSQNVTATGGDGTVAISMLGGSLPTGLTLQAGGSGAATITGTPSKAGTFSAILRARDTDGDLHDRLYTFVIDPEGVQSNTMLMFRGADIPLTANPYDGGRFDLTVAAQTYESGELYSTGFNFASPLFYGEYGVNPPNVVLPATSPLTMYGGASTRALSGGGRTGPPENFTLWPGLRQRSFRCLAGDSVGPSRLDLCLLWKPAQFASMGSAGTYQFGASDATATLQVDLVELVDGDNDLRFIVVDNVGGQERWYVSEAAWTSRYLLDGVFRLQGFNGSSAPGKRWAEVTPPAGNDMHIDLSAVTYAAHTFTDVQAVGLRFSGTRGGYHYGFGFNRFFALGVRN